MDHSETYVQKLLEIGFNRTAQIKYNHSQYADIPSNIKSNDIFDLSDGNYIVVSGMGMRHYRVNMTTGFCQCPIGKTCGPCKHKTAIARFIGNAGFSVIPINYPNMKALWHYIAVGKIQPDYMYRGENNSEFHGNIREFIAGKIAEEQPTETADVTTNMTDISMEADESDVDVPNGHNVEVMDDNYIENFITMWNRYGQRVANEMRNNRTNYDFKRCVKSAMAVLKKSEKFTLPTVQKHLSLFGKEIYGRKVKGKRSIQIPVQPTSVSRSRANGTIRRGRKAVNITCPHKDRSEETNVTITENGKMVNLQGLGKLKKKKPGIKHSFQSNVNDNVTIPRRHDKQ